MKLAKIIGTIEATAKDPSLVGQKLLLADLVDGLGHVIEPAIVAIDNAGAGVGDQVLITFNTAARIPNSTAGKPVDAAIIAIIDKVSLATPAVPARRKN